jgi:glycerol-3-phosphate acyltransferase PlsY
VILFVIFCIVCYLIGSVPTGILLVRLLKGMDIRQFGSGSSGATNVSRVLGLKFGLLVLLVDTAKGFFPIFYLAPFLAGTGQIQLSVVPIKIILGLFAIAGHVWTVFANFKGGKGVGTGAGVILAISPLATVLCLAIWTIIFAVTRYVSIASMIAAISFPIVIFAMGHPDKALQIFSVVLALLIIFTHRRNITRLLKGQEHRFG